MGTVEVVEGDATEVVVSRAIAVRPPVDVSNWTPTMVQTIEDAVAQVEARDDFMQKVMRKDLDYGVIPGTGKKPSLLKPGAERLLTAYGLHPELEDEVSPVLDYTGNDHNGEPFFEFRRRCRIWRQTGPGERERMLVAQASGACNSWEVKYRYREGSATLCPECSQVGIRFVANADYIPGGKGWYHAKGKGGCGAKIIADSPQGRALDAQKTESATRELNPDPADLINTILKMSDKRALVAATIIATGWSDLVTQDLEDRVDAPPGDTAPGTTTTPPAGGAAPRASEQTTTPARTPLPHEGEPCPECAKLGLKNTRGNIAEFFVPNHGANAGKVICNGRCGDDLKEWAGHYPAIATGETPAVVVNDQTPIPF